MVTYKIEGNIGIVEFNDADSSANVLSYKNLDLLGRIVKEIALNSKYIKALFFISAKEDMFIAGADIKELMEVRSKKDALELCKKGQDLFNEIERLVVPSFAIINGACVGGGLELALSCTHIIAIKNKKVKIGLPEVRLGIVPGFGGGT
ncbi:enoyl-CoA hydratase-related protein [Candidatus Omnitrophota bacterium]